MKYVLLLEQNGSAEATVGPFETETDAERYAVDCAGPEPQLKGRSWKVHLLQAPITIPIVVVTPFGMHTPVK